MTVALISLYDEWSAGNRAISSVTNGKGIDARLIFFRTLEEIYHPPPSPECFDALMALLAELKPELVGVSVRSQFWWMARRISRRVREELKVPVVIGGVHPTLNPEEAILEADYICRGEGELAVPELVRRIRDGLPTDDIPGLWTRKPKGEIARNEPIIAIKDLDEIPLHVTDKSYYVRRDGPAIKFDPIFDDKTHTLYMISGSRGCPFHCSFCCESVYKDIFGTEGKSMRRRSVENMFAEYRLVKEKLPNLNIVPLLDEVFHPPEEWMDEFVRRYKTEVGYQLSAMIHPGLISEKWVDSMLKIGVPIAVDFGLQSGSERVRREIFDRPTSDKMLDNVLKVLNKYDFMKWIDIIVDNPFESPEDARLGVLTIFKFKRPLRLLIYSMMFYAGLPITEKAIEAGFAKRDSLPGYKEDCIELWIPKLEDPRGDPLKTWSKTLLALHQLRSMNPLKPPHEFNPIPMFALRRLAKKKIVTAKDARRLIRFHDLALKLSLKTYTLGTRILKFKDLVKRGRFVELARRTAGLTVRTIRGH